MSEAIVFGDAEQLVIDYLAAELPDYGHGELVCSEVPEDRPQSFVRVLCTGGVKQTLVSEFVRITIQAWAPTSIASHDLAQVCRALVHALAKTTQAGVPVYSVTDISRPQQQPDPLSASPRSVFTVELHVRGQLLTSGS